MSKKILGATAVSRSALVRCLIERDLLEVVAIERASFGAPWGIDDFRRFMRKSNSIGSVIEDNDQVVGYICYKRLGRNLRKLAHVINLAVAPVQRRKGYATHLLRRLTRKVDDSDGDDYEQIILDCPESLTHCHLLLRSCGFRGSILDRHRDGDTYRFIYEAAAKP
jgi:ribosomal protein S18 acetylase RimI-like enzyme